MVQYVYATLQAELNALHACLREHISQKSPYRIPISDLRMIVNAKNTRALKQLRFLSHRVD